MNRKTSASRRFITLVIIGVSVITVIGLVWLFTRPPTSITSTQPTTTNDSKPRGETSQPQVTRREAKVAYITIGDEGKSGELVGCGDSVTLVDSTVQSTDAVQGALQALLADKTERHGQPELYNALWQSSLTVDSVVVVNQIATVALSGNMQLSGECDSPRVKAQLESTVKASGGVSTVNITINGKTLDDALSLK